MNETIDIIIKSGTLIFVAISTGLALRVYYRNKRIELENSLFKSRLEAIGNIQMELAIFLQQIDKVKRILREADKYSHKEKRDLANEFDEKLYNCEASITKYAAYFSDFTSRKLIQFAQNIYDQHSGVVDEYLIGLGTYEEYINKNAEEIIAHLRSETGLEEIHQTMMKRLNRTNTLNK